MISETLKNKITTAPKLPGNYLFRDSMGNIIYVGKAKSLRARVRSYFTAAAQKDERIEELIRQIADVDFSVTSSETEALLQEYRLIKQHKPWFNSQLKRDTPHPFLRIDTASEYPSITIADEPTDDGAEYFGSFFDIYDALETIEVLNSIWRTPLCKQAPLPKKACLYRGIGRCTAPCEATIAVAEYRNTIAEVAAILRGNRAPTMDQLDQEINQHIRDLAFEKAAASQKKLAAAEKLRRRGQKFFRLQPDQDALVLVRAYHAQECVLFFLRRGIVMNRVYLSAGMRESESHNIIVECLCGEPKALIEEWTTDCFTEIFADKQFIPLQQEMPVAVVAAVARRTFFELFATKLL